MTATLLTVGELREHLETDLSDEALQRILNAEEAEIVRRYGPTATQTEMQQGGQTLLVLWRKAGSITSVIETAIDNVTQTTLAANDYRLWPSGQLERLVTGTHPAAFWAPLVTVTYVPEDQSAQRKGVLVQLAALAAKYNGLKSESVGGGDYSATSLDYTIERERLLRSLAGRKLWVV